MQPRMQAHTCCIWCMPLRLHMHTCSTQAHAHTACNADQAQARLQPCARPTPTASHDVWCPGRCRSLQLMQGRRASIKIKSQFSVFLARGYPRAGSPPVPGRSGGRVTLARWRHGRGGTRQDIVVLLSNGRAACCDAHTAPAPCPREGVTMGDLIKFGLATVVTRFLPSRNKGKIYP
jgi:hypothetical protein